MLELNLEQVEWQSRMTRNDLKERHKILKKIRDFFDNKGLIEVETPILAQAAVTDVHLDSFTTNYLGKEYFLNTSPEFHMKRLLAGGSGPIYQICKCFRLEPTSRKHNPEFTMLEWYQPNYSLQRLLDEVEELFKVFFDFTVLERYTYEYIFKKYLGVSPLDASHRELVELAKNYGLYHAEKYDKDTILEFLFSTCIEPYLGQENPVAIYNYPASQAALAQITAEDPRTAQRAEVFYRGIELANGFYELTNWEQQKERFQADLYQRASNNQDTIAFDQKFLAALKHGMPQASGIALGLDRFIMLVMQEASIAEVMTFTIENA
ncbi:elongation factor P--(R)-beta-lysine ligase [Psittacicella gerlachiana]|uniref:Elongation factor P lysine(34) lysyltransferase n=1 Tax=Psittacicella gerlachiana TaxID=2028574 RepID=A0A3A1YDG4_9GAMM|nr:elongation factor P--(R)-beta-lysine ligase [Psittacicella gerlachiana]RIY35210.1 elongation factor P lysine(34) lysyltransferase [Psittacicella gerlachiana]